MAVKDALADWRRGLIFGGAGAQASVSRLVRRCGFRFAGSWAAPSQRDASLPADDIPSSQVLHPEIIPYGTFSMIAWI